uniref:Uncharacterized protein n=1 Tax=Myotis myotis TaxID=51298 RepID=A0A7J7VIT8_MYOMY|nr:hypothetical protein mMyoMyo1_008320 [Myotis myotis]
MYLKTIYLCIMYIYICKYTCMFIHILEAPCTKFMHWGLRGSLSLACNPITVWGPCSLGPLAPYCPPAVEVGEARTTAAALASHEPGFWLNSCIECLPPGGQCRNRDRSFHQSFCHFRVFYVGYAYFFFYCAYTFDYLILKPEAEILLLFIHAPKTASHIQILRKQCFLND